MYTLGIDVGSITTKAAVMQDREILGTKVIFTGYRAEAAGSRIMDEILKELGLSAEDIKAVVATGYGRKSITAATKSITEIMCHAAGAFYLVPAVRTIIDIGG
ncbi:MAG: BadF/BadG/BcrA/BcrD ATPase family protein, partial [Syntrophales bacterium]|nr:BadF/BadG/BcrA/BcrD ATPase family protein [Syntrophales bacterium]